MIEREGKNMEVRTEWISRGLRERKRRDKNEKREGGSEEEFERESDWKEIEEQIELRRNEWRRWMRERRRDGRIRRELRRK